MHIRTYVHVVAVCLAAATYVRVCELIRPAASTHHQHRHNTQYIHATVQYSETSLHFVDTMGTQLSVLYRKVSLIQR